MGNLLVGSFTKNGVSAAADSQEHDEGQPPRKQQRCNALDRETSPHADGGESPREQDESDQPHQRAELPVVGKPTTDFEDLPDEVAIMILSYSKLNEILEITQHVCQRWRRLSHDPEVWKNKTFYIDSSCSEDEAVIKLQQMKQLRSLEVEDDIGLSVIDAVCENCKQLTSLSLGYSPQIDHLMLEKLVNQCTNITVLEIYAGLLDSEYKAETVAKLQRLQSLAVEYDPEENRRIYLRPLADKCPDLHSLEVTEMISVFGEDLQYFLNTKSGALSRLVLPWAIESSNGTRCIVPLLRVCSALNYLLLLDYHVTAEEAPEAFAALGHLSTLKTLVMDDLEMCPAGEAALHFELGKLSHLQFLQIVDSNIQDNIVLAVCLHCRELKQLDLIGCHRITDDSLRNLHHLRKLETLELSGCTGLRGGSLPRVAMVAGLKTLWLERLDMRNLEPGLGTILDLASLEVLCLNYSLYVNIFPFDRLASKLLHLRELNLIDCLVDDSVLKSLQEQMPNLKVKLEPGEE